MNIAGHKVSSWWVIGGGAGVVAAIWFTRHHSSSSAASGTSSSSAIDPVTGLPASMDSQDDPVTGLTYLAEAQEYGSVQAAEQEITSGSAYYGQTGATSATDSGYPTLYEPETSPTGPGQYSTNAAWAQAVTSGLTGLGYTSTSVSQALGLYFAQAPLSSTQASIIQAAEAEYGPPPQGTYSIIPEPSSGGSTPTGGNVSGTVTGLYVSSLSATSATLAWQATPGATGYVIDQASPAIGPQGNLHTTTQDSAVISGLKPSTAYTYYVTAEPAATGHASVSFKTPASGTLY